MGFVAISLVVVLIVLMFYVAVDGLWVACSEVMVNSVVCASFTEVFSFAWYISCYCLASR